ncbi:MAG: GNAT family N-acetyltransferase [Planctomycetota bacterium]
MQVTRLHDLDSCRKIASAWDCMAHTIPFRGTAWLHKWWEHFRGTTESDGELFVLQVTDEAGEIVGIAPWFRDRSVYHGRVVRPLGAGKVCSEYLGILATAEHERDVARALAQWLVAAADGHHGPENCWDLLDLVSVDAEDSGMAYLAADLETAGTVVHRRDAMSCWRIMLPESWDEYVAGLGKSRRKQVRRIDRKWLESGAMTFRTARTLEEVEYGLNILEALHQERQESVGHQGCFSDPAFSGFLWDAAKCMLEQRTLELHWIEMDGIPWAAEYQFTGGNVTYDYLGGISRDKRKYGPGQIVQVAVLKRSIRQQRSVFDFLRGNEAYKFGWAVQERKCHDVRVVPQRRLPRLRHRLWLAGGSMKHWIRTGMDMTGLHEVARNSGHEIPR